MSYKFEKTEVYKSQKRMIELSVQALKICIDPNINFEPAGEHEITYSCTHQLCSTDLIHHINDEIIITKETYEDSDGIDSYNLYIYDNNADDKWYLVSYLCNDQSGNSLYISDSKQINFNIDENYIAYYDESLPFDERNIRLSLPFTRDQYFNFSMSIDFGISYEEIIMVLDFVAPDGFTINMYSY